MRDDVMGEIDDSHSRRHAEDAPFHHTYEWITKTKVRRQRDQAAGFEHRHQREGE
jgi:hypothetical protein